jgi:hypothetical protein
MNTNTAIFPDTAVGTYNIIAYDNCGISRSFTFSITDTCGCRPPRGGINSSHNGESYVFSDSIVSGTGPYTYVWNFGDGSAVNDSAIAHHSFPKSGVNSNYVVTLIISGACGSDTVRKTVTVINGIEDISLAEHVSVYPNPNNGSFTMAVDGISSTMLAAEVTDMQGRSIHKQNIHAGENKFELQLAPGVYMIKIWDGDAHTTKMLTVK